MSINVTVNSNPVCGRRSRIVLSDLEQIKKNERDRRRRLRLEQVRQQSKEISCKLLERAKNIAKKEFDKLIKDDKSGLRKMHDRKIMELQRKYQEDMEDIGMAHSAAALQPDVDVIIEVQQEKNRVAAAERGKEAVRRLKESLQKEDPLQIQQERLRQVREVENVRSAMISKLPSTSPASRVNAGETNSSGDDEIIVEKTIAPSPKQQKHKKILSKKSPAKVLSKPNVKVVGQHQKSKSPRRTSVEVIRSNLKSPKRAISRGLKGDGASKSSTKSKISQSVSVGTEVDCEDLCCNRDTENEEPLKTLQTIKLNQANSEKGSRYNPEDYKQKSSDTNSSSSSSVSDDSSYFSDGYGEIPLPKTSGKSCSSFASSKVELYDHCTKQRSFYKQPMGLVERTDIRNENAMEAAREIAQAESLLANLHESRRSSARRRGNDALLRECVRRDYEAMIKNYNNRMREERVPKPAIYCTNKRITEAHRNDCQTDRHEKVNDEIDIILHDTSKPGPSTANDERIATILSREPRERTIIDSDAAQRINPSADCAKCCEKDHNPEDMTRKEHILEMIKTFERQKRFLLRAFGEDLPNPIFRGSSASLVELRDSTQKKKPAPKQASPEIKIINMSNAEEKTKKPGKKKLKKKSKTPPSLSKTMETAVQTSRLDEIGQSEDKSVQVEIISDENEETRISNGPRRGTASSQTLEYVEPRVTVITRDVHDSSSGSSVSQAPGIVIELENQQVKVTPRKRKSSSEKSSKRGSSRPRSKPRSLPSSSAGSPVKRSVISAPSSRSSSPKKIDITAEVHSRSPRKILDIVVDKETIKVQSTSSRSIRLIEDSTLESSPPHSTPEVHETSGKPYRIYKHPTFKRVRETKDISDTSTSYASLPATSHAAIQTARDQITPILEMLDSSTNETMRPLKIDVSPVSTPQTPSPRTMNIPSNLPNAQRIGRVLKYSANHEINGDSTLPSSTLNENSSSTDPSVSQMQDRRSDTHISHRSGKSSGYCSCVNPTCEQLHNNMTDIRKYAMDQHPEVVAKYNDLQNVCTERIASLTALIKRVRNEQLGMEFSLSNPADETSLMQIPPARQRPTNDFQNFQMLVDNIEAIHSKLAKTLLESQKIMSNGIQVQPASSNAQPRGSSPSNETKSKGSTSTSTEETPGPSSRGKPIIIADEQVQIDLESLKRGRDQLTTMLVQTGTSPWPATPRRHEEELAKLSEEILEQSKTVDKSRHKNNPSDDESLSRQRTPSPPAQTKNRAATRKPGSPVKIIEDEVTKDERSQTKKDEAFVPLLAGIPKIPHALPSVPSVARPRPPPAGGPYRSELISPRHELSTIVEFDTPDTVNRSHGSTKSPNGKSRRLLQLQSPSTRSPMEKNADAQTSPIRKSSIPVAPLSPSASRAKSRGSTTRDVGSQDEKFVLQVNKDRPMLDHETTKSLLSQGPRASINGCGVAMPKEEIGKSIDWAVNGRDGRADGHENGGKLVTYDEKLVSLMTSRQNVDSGVGHENKTDKLTSTSSNSISGLSGISEIVSTPTSELAKWASSSEEIETALKKMGLGWAIVTLKKTREASALSSSSNSDVTPMNTARRTKSPSKWQISDCNNPCGLPDFSDVSSISIKEISKSTERALLMKARTSTPNIQNSNTTSEKSTSATASSSGISIQDPSDSLTAPNLSLNNKK